MFKEFMLKKMLRAKGVPADQIDFFLEIIQKNPELFQKIAQEIEQKIKTEGKNEMQAGQEVMTKYQSELQQIIKK